MLTLRKVSLWLMGGSLSMIGLISIAAFACKKGESDKPRTPPAAPVPPGVRQAPPPLDVVRRFKVGDMVRVKLDGRVGQVTVVEDDRQAAVHKDVSSSGEQKIVRWSQYVLSIAVPAEKGYYATIRVHDFQLEPASTGSKP